MTNPFDYVNSILYNKKNIIDNESSEREYVPFLTNKALSYYPDTLFYAQEMNVNNHIDKKLQFDYLINNVRLVKRPKSKWAKKKENNDIDALQDFFGYSYQKAKVALSVLSKDQLKEIKRRIEKGGANE